MDPLHQLTDPVSEGIYKSEDENLSVNDSGIHKAEEVVFNSFFSFIDDPEKDRGSGENLEEDIKQNNKVRGKKKKLSDQASGEYFEEDIKPKEEEDTVIKENKRKTAKLFDCSDCDFSTNYPEQLRQHDLSVHHGVVRYSCPLCQFKSFFKHQVGHHIGSSHRGQTARIMLLDCSLCKRGEAHDECSKSGSRKAAKLFKCEKCEFKSSSGKSLKNHVSIRHEKINKYFCSLCDKKSFYKHHIKIHLLSHGKEPGRVLTIGCLKCEREEDHPRCFEKQKYQIKTPKTEQKGIKPSENDQPIKQETEAVKQEILKTGKYKCDDCNYSHNQRSIVKRHTDSVHKGILKFFCRECSYKTFYKYAMILHLKSHGVSSDQPLRIGCKKCELNIEHRCDGRATGNLLKRKKISKPKYTKEFRCDACQISFPNIRKLSRHNLSRKHQGIVRFKCNVCDFKHLFSLHVRIHQETIHADKICKVIRIGCEDCDNDISNHNCVRFKKKKKKIEKKPALNCDECQYSTHLRKSLSNHFQSVHLNLVRYCCDSCQYKSFFKKHVQIHQKQTHSEQGADIRVKTIGCEDCSDNVDHECWKPTKFKCETCTYSTKIKNNLKMHIEARHEYLVRFACSSCDKKAYYKKNLEKHISRGHKDCETKLIEIQCPGCKTQIGHNNCLRKLELKLHCEACNYSTNAQTNLSNHIKKDHLKMLRFSCGNCAFKSFYRHHVAAHQIRAHRGEDCEIVKIQEGQTVNKVQRRGRKPQSQEGGSLNQFRCDKCDFSSHSRVSLRIHNQNIHENVKKFACSVCDYKSYFSQGVRRHLLKHSDGPEPGRVIKVGCLPCLSAEPHSCVKTQRNDAGRDHERSTPGPTIECSLCSDRPSFPNKRRRLAHHKEAHPGKHIFTCEHCQYGTNYLPNLNTHTRSQHEKRRLECDKCDWWTTWNPLFHKHQREKHGYFKKKSKHYSDGQQYLCDQCAFSTFSRLEFEKHKDHRNPGLTSDSKVLRAGSKGRRFIVPLVPKAFRCKEREYSTDLSGNMKAHIKQVHEGIMYQCDQCDYKATARHNLKVHVDNIHLGLRYKCESCEHFSTTRANLKLHNKTMHGVGGVKIQCNKCDYATFHVSNLRKHLATVHQKNKEN